MKTCFMLLLLITLVNSLDNRFKQRSLVRQRLQNLIDYDEQEYNPIHRNNRRIFNDDEQYMEIRATTGSNETNTGPEITLQNRAAMNTRLRVLYTDENGNPSIAETGRLWAGQTKSVKLPINAKHIVIIVEKDFFFESWRVAYKSPLTDENQCIRIIGVTFFSRIHPCK